MGMTGSTARFLEPVTGRERNPLRFLGLLAIAAILGVLGILAMGFGVLALAPELMETLQTLEPVPEGPDRLIGESQFIVIIAITLGILALAVWVAAAIVYRRGLGSFVWPRGRFGWDQFLIGMGVAALALGGLGVVEVLSLGLEVRPPLLNVDYPLDHRLIYAGVALVGLLVAAAAEEVVFRGVLLQITGGFTKNALVLCVLNGLAFSAFHLDPDPVAFVARFVSGAVWAWAALRLGSLAFAIGAHLANNLMIALFVEPFSEAAQVAQGYPLQSLPGDLAATLVMLGVIEWLARRRSTEPATAD